MIRSCITVLAFVTVVACSGSDPADDQDAAFRETCTFVLSDESLSQNLSSISTTPDIACDCLQAHIADNERDYTLVTLFLEDVAAEMEASGIGAEAAARQLSMFAPLPADTAGAQDTFTDAMPVFHRAFQPVMGEIAANDGQCPARGPDAE